MNGTMLHKFIQEPNPETPGKPRNYRKTTNPTLLGLSILKIILKIIKTTITKII